MVHTNRLQTLVGYFLSHHNILILLLILVIAPTTIRAEFEKPGTLKAQSFVDSKLLKGKNYTVKETVQNDGILNHYEVSSTFGDFKPVSTSSLVILLHEIEAIAEMKKVETDDTAIESLKQSGKNTVDGVKNLVTDPKNTLESAAAGIGSLFNRASETIGKRETTEAEDSKLTQLIGFSKSKGDIANRYGVSMYSRNEVLQAELERLGWADYLGGLGVGVATSAVPGAGGLLLTTSGTARLLNEAINTTPASELWVQNKNNLLALGMNEDTIELFLNQPHFSPALQTVMVKALGAMKGVENLELYLKIALQASNPAMAKIITESAAMTAGYHKHVAPLKGLTPMARLARAEKSDGTAVLILPNDHIIWSQTVEKAIKPIAEDKNRPGGAGLEIWALGDFSDMAHQKLKENGWKVHTRVREQLMPKEK